MAIAFYVPDEEELHTGSGTTAASTNTTSSSAASSTGTSSSVQSPPASPINTSEFLIAFYDAIYKRISNAATVEPQHSPSCPTCGSPGIFSPTRSTTPVASAPGSPQSENVDRSRRTKRKRLSSIGEELSDEEVGSDDSGSESSSNDNNNTIACDDVLDSHLRHLEEREKLELFTGPLPPPKTSSSSSSRGSKATSKNNVPQTRSKTKISSN